MLRRVFLQSGLGVCCAAPALRPGTYEIVGSRVLIDLDRAIELRLPASAVKIVEPAHRVRLLLAQPEPDLFVAVGLDCPHERGELDLDLQRQGFTCATGHQSRFSLDGLKKSGPANQPLKIFPVVRRGRTIEVQL